MRRFSPLFQGFPPTSAALGVNPRRFPPPFGTHSGHSVGRGDSMLHIIRVPLQQGLEAGMVTGGEDQKEP